MPSDQEHGCWGCGQPVTDTQRWIVWTHVVGVVAFSPLAPIGWPVHIRCDDPAVKAA
jgi:hypothetical protein